MKGKASIILTDADSGRIVRRLEEKNIITNAVSNVFNMPLEYRMNAISQAGIITSGLPIRNTLMGGIVLLGNNIDEDADNIFLPKNAKIIAAAGSPYSGTSTYIGSLNENECSELSNGYRLTWDFATDKANGTIKCVCLTSRQFGNSSVIDSDTTRGVSFVNPASMTNVTTNSVGSEIFCGKGQYIYSKSLTRHVFFGCNADGQLRFIEQTSIDPKNIRINDTAGSSVLCAQEEEHIITPPFTFVNDRRFFFDPDKMYLYFFKEREYDRTADITKVQYIAIDLKTYTIAEHKFINLEGECPYDLAAIYYDSLFITYGQTLYRYRLDGSVARVYDSDITATNYFVINGCLYTHMTNNILYMVTPEKGYKLSKTNGYNVSDASLLNPPLIATAARASHGLNNTLPTTTVFAQMFNTYMASINNLSEPIKKTYSQTLKIVYEITN